MRNYNYGINVLKLLRGGSLLRPLAATFYATTHCNLNCSYCEDFGAKRNHLQPPHLSLDDAKHILRVIRSGMDGITITGGEPLLYPDIDKLVLYAHNDLKFKQITMLTNGALLSQHESILPALNRLVISIDSVDAPFWATVINAPQAVAERILENVKRYGRLQSTHKYSLILNCVLSPDTLTGAADVLDFCLKHDVSVSFSPQAVDDWPRYELVVSAEYKAFIDRLIGLKRSGAPIAGSTAYLRSIRDFTPYACYPTLIPRVMADGGLVYPCRPIERRGGANGGRPANLLAVESWDEAMELATAVYGEPPRHCSSCFQQCFAEPSLMQSRPLDWMAEQVRYAPSRHIGLTDFAPG